jgi:protein phosphatase
VSELQTPEGQTLYVQPDAEFALSLSANLFSMTVAPGIELHGLTHIGPVREENQDAIRLPDGDLSAERGLLCALADGMGGYAHGGLASTLALDVLFQTFYGEDHGPAPKSLRHGVESANLNVYQTAQQMGAGRMGTTLTAVHMQGNRVCLVHIGDSRAYLVRDGRATCLTRDHTTVGDLVRMKVLAPEKVRTHAQRSILNRAIGLGLFVQPDIIEIEVAAGDRLILCSDGLWSVVEDHEFARLAAEAEGTPALVHKLVNLALERETDDNVSAIVIHIQQLAPAAPTRRGRGLISTLRRHFDRDSQHGTSN